MSGNVKSTPTVNECSQSTYSARNISDEPKRIRVIGFERTKNRLHGRLHCFKVEGWDKSQMYSRRMIGEVLAATTENNKRIKEILRLKEERDKIEEEYGRKISNLVDELTVINVTDFVKEI